MNLNQLILISSLLFGFNLSAQIDYHTKINSQRKIHEATMFSDSSYLDSTEKSNLLHLNYYKIDSNYVITAKIKKKKGKKFEMPTSSERKKWFRQYAILTFDINDTTLSVPIYQNLGLLKHKEYKNYLFFPIRDLTAPNETYGAGRYLELEKVKGKTMILDFNELFNPYCALSNRYSCPITPKENWVNVRIEAGEKLPSTKDNH